MDELMIRSSGWQGRPLCSRYLLVLIETLSVNPIEDGLASDGMLCWASGVLASGEHEVLGVWPMSFGVAGWQHVFGDLRARGVEKIQFVSGTEVAIFGAALTESFPGAIALSPVWNVESVGSVLSRYRSAVRRGFDLFQHLQRRAKRATASHGAFCSLADAAQFVTIALGRADRSIAVAGTGRDLGPMRRSAPLRTSRPVVLSLVN